MNFFDNALVSFYNLMENLVAAIERSIGVDFITSFSRLLEQSYSTAVIISSAVLLITGITAYVQFKELYPWIIYVALFAPVGLLFLSFFAESFHDACDDLIQSNETTLSNGAYLRFAAVISFLFSVLYFLAGLVLLIKGTLGASMAIGILVLSFFFLLSTAPLFNPSLLNVVVTSKSSSGEDFIALLSLNLKVMVFFEKIISRLLIIGGGICLIVSLIETMPYIYIGLGMLTLGIIFPILVYLIFILFYFWFSLLSSLLSMGRK
jgi:hypothetical protein